MVSVICWGMPERTAPDYRPFKWSSKKKSKSEGECSQWTELKAVHLAMISYDDCSPRYLHMLISGPWTMTWSINQWLGRNKTRSFGEELCGCTSGVSRPESYINILQKRDFQKPPSPPLSPHPLHLASLLGHPRIFQVSPKDVGHVAWMRTYVRLCFTDFFSNRSWLHHFLFPSLRVFARPLVWHHSQRTTTFLIMIKPRGSS